MHLRVIVGVRLGRHLTGKDWAHLGFGELVGLLVDVTGLRLVVALLVPLARCGYE